MFTENKLSKIGRGYIVLYRSCTDDAETWTEVLIHMLLQMMLRDMIWTEMLHGTTQATVSFSGLWNFVWRERVEERERQGVWLRHHCDDDSGRSH